MLYKADGVNLCHFINMQFNLNLDFLYVFDLKSCPKVFLTSFA